MKQLQIVWREHGTYDVGKLLDKKVYMIVKYIKYIKKINLLFIYILYTL